MTGRLVSLTKSPKACTTPTSLISRERHVTHAVQTSRDRHVTTLTQQKAYISFFYNLEQIWMEHTLFLASYSNLKINKHSAEGTADVTSGVCWLAQLEGMARGLSRTPEGFSLSCDVMGNRKCGVYGAVCMRGHTLRCVLLCSLHAEAHSSLWCRVSQAVRDGP